MQYHSPLTHTSPPTGHMPMFEKPPKTVCLLRLSAIGDCCHVLPVLRTLQNAWPDTDFTWIIGATEAAVLGDIPGVHFITVDKSRTLRSLAAVRRELRSKPFDLLLHMHPNLRANLLSLNVKARIRLGFDGARAKDGQRLFTNAQIPAGDRQHVMDGFFEFARTLGIADRDLRWDIPISDADRAFAERHIPEGQPVLVISPCSSPRRGRRLNVRNWRAERYATVADNAISAHGARIILTGDASSTSRAMADDVRTHARGDVTDLTGQTTLKQLLAIIESATALLCPDSGPAHMGTAVGTPVIGLYAGTNPERAGPYLSGDFTLNRYPEAVQQELRQTVDEVAWGTRLHNPEIMDLISVDEVCEQVDRVFASAPDPCEQH